MKNETPRWWKRIALTATLIAACIGVVGCTDDDHKDVDISDMGLSRGVHRIKSGECAYVIYSDGTRGGIVHAGDCRNPNHKENQR